MYFAIHKWTGAFSKAYIIIVLLIVLRRLERLFSTLLMLCPFNIVSHVVVMPNPKIIFVDTS